MEANHTTAKKRVLLFSSHMLVPCSNLTVSNCYFLLASLKSLNCENLSSNPPQIAFSRMFWLTDGHLWLLQLFRKPPVILKIVLKARHEFTLRKIDQ